MVSTLSPPPPFPAILKVPRSARAPAHSHACPPTLPSRRPRNLVGHCRPSGLSRRWRGHRRHGNRHRRVSQGPKPGCQGVYGLAKDRGLVRWLRRSVYGQCMFMTGSVHGQCMCTTGPVHGQWQGRRMARSEVDGNRVRRHGAKRSAFV
eukprot:356534-Chlamydomonas_euryale.AAC.18